MSEDFKHQAVEYSKFRPLYPPELFDWLDVITTSKDTSLHKVAWDCATGNGQAALGLTKYFTKIIATDVNQTQLDKATYHPNIEYQCASAENCNLEEASIDLITVACGIHWLNREIFYKHAHRVLKPSGVIAVWTYDWPWTGYQKIDNILLELKEDILGKYWTVGSSELYFGKYKNLDFPFKEISVPSFTVNVGYTVEHILHFLSTWSAVQRFKRDTNGNPIHIIDSRFREAWEQEKPIVPICIPLHCRAGNKSNDV
jgi:SAM-dependent methyltransferase